MTDEFLNAFEELRLSSNDEFISTYRRYEHIRDDDNRSLLGELVSWGLSRKVLLLTNCGVSLANAEDVGRTTIHYVFQYWKRNTRVHGRQ